MEERKNEIMTETPRVLFDDLVDICYNYRYGEAGTTGDNDSVSGFLNAVWDLLIQEHRNTPFTEGCISLGIGALENDAQASFFCLVEQFLRRPMIPVGRDAFAREQCYETFYYGINSLVESGLARTMSNDMPGYILSPYACSKILRGRDDLITPSLISEFGDWISPREIEEKNLIFREQLSRKLDIVEASVSADNYERIKGELRKQKLRESLTFLLYGPPGTGKTEYILQLARKEKKNVFKIDSAKLDCSLFGEEPKKIRALFLMMQYIASICENPPMFFIDEADALLCNRVTVERSADKEQNMVTNILLEELNVFSGILFVSTNNLAYFDPAMNRRFLMKIEFPLPDSDTRASIWASKIPFLNKKESKMLAERFPFSGAVIDNVASICILMDTVTGNKPSMDVITEMCEEQLEGGSKPTRRIGFDVARGDKQL